MKAIISNKKEIAKGTLMIELEIIEEAVSFKPGQFFMLELINPPYHDEKGNKRYFSIVNSPNEKDVLVMATRLSDSAFKRSLNELPVGTTVEIDHIAGLFTLPKEKTASLVFIAGGIGITPFMSMLRYIAEEKLDYNVTVFYSNREKASTAFYDELQELGKRMKNIKVVFTMTNDPDWHGESRMLDVKFIKDYFPEPDKNIYMVAGPPPMVKGVVETLKAARVDEENIITDNFVGY